LGGYRKKKKKAFIPIPVIPATQEVEIGRILALGLPRLKKKN
jgi:hypothetical protein